MPDIIGASDSDTLFPGALIRVTFQKASFLHTASQFYDASQDVYGNLTSVANVYPMGSGYNSTAFPLVLGEVAWTVDVRTQRERTVAELASSLSDACDRLGLDIVEVGAIEVLTPASVKTANSTAGAAARQQASSTVATTTAAPNVSDALKKGAAAVTDALSGTVRNILIALVLVAVVLYFVKKK